MKKIKSFKTFAFGLILLTSNELLSQGTTWNLTGNNNATSSTFVGTTTSQPLIFKTNNAERLRISQTGQFIFTGLGTTGIGFLTTNSGGQLQRTTFTGNSNQVLLGDGTFGNLPASYFTLNGTNQLSTTFKLGVGILYPTEMLEVNGNGVFNGTITTQKVIISDVAMASDRLLFRNSGMLMEGYNPADGTRNEIASVSQPLFINSMSSMFQNTIINNDNTGKVGIGTINPEGKLDVNGVTYLREDLFLPNITEDLTTEGSFLFIDENKKVTSITKSGLHGILYAPPADPATPCVSELPGGSSSFNAVWSNGPNKLYVKCPDVKVGIGTDSPQYSLDVRGKASFLDGIKIGTPISNPHSNFAFIDVNTLNPNIPFMRFSVTNSSGNEMVRFKVEQNGGLYCTSVRVRLESNIPVPDFVFEKKYKLMPINELNTYVQTNKHLPEIPSEKQIREEGLNIEEMQLKLLQKIEELTLYIIELNTKNVDLNKELENQKIIFQKEIDELKKQIEN